MSPYRYLIEALLLLRVQERVLGWLRPLWGIAERGEYRWTVQPRWFSQLGGFWQVEVQLRAAPRTVTRYPCIARATLIGATFDDLCTAVHLWEGYFTPSVGHTPPFWTCYHVEDPLKLTHLGNLVAWREQQREQQRVRHMTSYRTAMPDCPVEELPQWDWKFDPCDGT